MRSALPATALLLGTFLAPRPSDAGGAARPGGPYAPRPAPPTDGLVGSNYTPAYAVNQVHFWHDFRPDVVERELAAARRHFGITTLRVWFNRMHPSSDPERGLRIDHTDGDAPVLSGSIGVRAHRTAAWFDNVVVMPLE